MITEIAVLEIPIGLGVRFTDCPIANRLVPQSVSLRIQQTLTVDEQDHIDRDRRTVEVSDNRQTDINRFRTFCSGAATTRKFRKSQVFNYWRTMRWSTVKSWDAAKMMVSLSARWASGWMGMGATFNAMCSAVISTPLECCGVLTDGPINGFAAYHIRFGQ